MAPTDPPWEEAIRTVLHKVAVHQSAKKLQVCRSGLHEYLNGNITLNTTPGPRKYMSPDEEKKVVEVVTARSQAGECIKRSELRKIIRQFALAAKPDEIPDTFPNEKWVHRFIQRHKSHFSRQEPPVADGKGPRRSTAELLRDYRLRQTGSVVRTRQPHDLAQEEREQISRRLEAIESKLQRELAEQKRHSDEQVKQLEELHREHQQIQEKQHMQLLTVMQQIQEQQATMFALIKFLAPPTSPTSSGDATGLLLESPVIDRG